jgi:hypothetical protein
MNENIQGILMGMGMEWEWNGNGMGPEWNRMEWNGI